jgi:hypothetical protein
MSSVEAHLAGGPINRLHCLLSRGIWNMEIPIDPRHGDDPDLEAPLIPNGFTGIGSETTARIWYQALVNMRGFPPPVTFLPARIAALGAAIQLYGRTSAEYKAVEDAFAAIRVGDPADRDPPEVSVPSKFIRLNEPFHLVVTDASGVASVTVVLDETIDLGTLTSPPWDVTIPSNLAIGSHTLTITAKDTEENEGSRTFEIILDLLGPATTFDDTSFSRDLGPRGYIRSFNFTAQDEAGVSTARVLLDGVTAKQPLPDQELSFSYIGLTFISETDHWVNLGDETAGPHTLALETTDTLDNKTTVTLPPFIRGYDPPSLCTLEAAVDSVDWSRVQMTPRASDTGSSIWIVNYLIDGQYWDSDVRIIVAPGATYVNTRKTPALLAGQRTFQVKCWDAQNNQSESAVLSLTLLPPCNSRVVAGTNQPSTTSFNMGKVSGNVTLTYQTFVVHDRIRVMTPADQLLLDVGCVATGDPTATATQNLSFSGTSVLKVVVDPNCNPVTAAPTTQWNYRLSCP